MTVGRASAVSPDTRLKMLRPYLRQLVGVLEKDASNEGLKLTISTFSLNVRAWQKNAILESQNQSLPTQWQTLAADATAVQARVLNDLARANKGAETGSQPSSQDHVLNMALLLAVDADIKDISRKLHAGGEAKSAVVQHMIQLRSDLRDALKKLDEVVDSSAVQDARLLSDEMRLGGETKDSKTPTTASTQSPKKAAPKTKRAKKKSSNEPSKRRVPKELLFAGIGSLVVSILLVGWLIMPKTVALEEGLARIDGLVETVDKKPHFVGVVDDARWTGMDDGAKTRFVFAVITNLRQHGYTSADLENSKGEVVADWHNQNVSVH